MLEVGIVGLPNAGKSTLFNALRKAQGKLAQTGSYPFTTIEPNVGVVPVPDERLTHLANIVEQEEGIRPPIVPATVEFVDIAGLVKGAAEGEGLGNKFLSHIREVDVICHVTRYFTDPNVMHVAGEIDPQRDQSIIETELILADLQTLNKQVETRGVKDKATLRRWELIQTLKIALDSGKPARDVIPPGDVDDRMLVKDLQLLTMKPVLYVANVSEDQLASVIPAKAGIHDRHMKIHGWIPDQVGNDSLIISAKIEAELASLPESEQREYLKSLGLEASGLDRLIKKAYEMLGLISFLTMGVKEVRAWTITKGTKAPQAAAVIHTDFEKKFIKAEVISFDDLIAVGSRKKAQELGKLRLEGREYEMTDGDVVEFKIGT
ncbi:MAG: redox-regulated ATPase YchF [Methylovulum sp.]|nr:MAG: redox-regulated ATPase YchF [Methylovulum sp.]